MKFTGKDYIHYSLQQLKVSFETEYKFLPNRKFRFDFAIPDKKIAIEYEGLISRKSRHTTIKGYSNDTEKYNLAAINGWCVLRYTILNYNTMYSDINKCLSLH